VFDALVPGDYTFKVTDANGCVYQDSYTVVDVTEIDIAGAIQNEISCNAVISALIIMVRLHLQLQDLVHH
jgi:hypothetical protein